MPWSNNTGGGGKGPWGNNGGNNGGPWGGGGNQGGGGGNNNQPPDLEDMLRKGQDSLKKVLPGGGSTGGAQSGSPKFMWGILGVLAVAFWLYQSFYQIEANQLGVELLFGKPKQEFSSEGLHFHLWPVESVEVVEITEQQITIGGTSRRGSASTQGLMLSGDQNIIEVAFAVLWRVGNPADYLFNVREPDDMLLKVAESAMREVVGRRPADDIYRDNRAAVELEVQKIIERSLEEYGAGVIVSQVKIEDAAPPREVADAFDEVQRAEQDEDRFVEEANLYSNQKLGQARGEAAETLEQAAAYKNRVVQEADGEAQRFLSIYEQYAKAPEVTRKRLFLETMEKVLRSSNKVIVEGGQGGSGVVPYLPLPELQKRASGGNQ